MGGQVLVLVGGASGWDGRVQGEGGRGESREHELLPWAAAAAVKEGGGRLAAMRGQAGSGR
jgi:hypothetical protein